MDFGGGAKEEKRARESRTEWVWQTELPECPNEGEAAPSGSEAT